MRNQWNDKPTWAGQFSYECGRWVCTSLLIFLKRKKKPLCWYTFTWCLSDRDPNEREMTSFVGRFGWSPWPGWHQTRFAVWAKPYYLTRIYIHRWSQRNCCHGGLHSWKFVISILIGLITTYDRPIERRQQHHQQEEEMKRLPWGRAHCSNERKKAEKLQSHDEKNISRAIHEHVTINVSFSCHYHHPSFANRYGMKFFGECVKMGRTWFGWINQTEHTSNWIKVR